LTEFRVDELARAAGITVRNLRAYQDHGLLPPPRREGRVGIYTDAHLARLRLIGQLLDRGYTFAHIAELVSAWEQGRELSEVLGLEQAVTGPWSDEIAGYVTGDELAEMFAGLEIDADAFERARRLGLIEIEGDRFRVPSPRLLHAGADLIRAGFPVARLLDVYELVAAHIDEVARQFVESAAQHIFEVHGKEWLPSADEVPELTDFLQMLRRQAKSSVESMLLRAMERHTRAVLGDYFSRVAD
jgi:DNA-binding transcriptional MerR regulator